MPSSAWLDDLVDEVTVVLRVVEDELAEAIAQTMRLSAETAWESTAAAEFHRRTDALAAALRALVAELWGLRLQLIATQRRAIEDRLAGCG